MGIVDTLRSITPIRLSLPLGIGLFNPISGILGRTFAKRIEVVRAIAHRTARFKVDDTRAAEIADDVVYEIWECLREGGKSSLDRSSSIASAIFGVVRNKLLMSDRSDRRRRAREKEHMTERAQSVHTWMDPEAYVNDGVAREARRRGDKRLSAAERQVAALRAAGLTYREIAERRGTSYKTVRKQVSNAIHVYREELTAADIPVAARRELRGRRQSPEADADAGNGSASSAGDDNDAE